MKITNKRTVAATVAGLAALLGGATPAAAATLSYSGTFSGVAAGHLLYQAFTPFDPDLGALGSISIAISNAMAGGYFAAAGPNNDSVSELETVDFSSHVELDEQFNGSFSPAPLAEASVGGTASCTAPALQGCRASGAPDLGAFSPQPLVLTDPANLALFTDTGPLVQLILSAAYGDVTSPWGDVAQDNTVYGATVTVTYNYTPAATPAVPEPASRVAMLTGFAALALTSRRRARRRPNSL